MDDTLRRRLQEAIASYGTALCDDSRRCEAVLRDVCGDSKREINVLIMALRERVPSDLLRDDTTPRDLLLARLTTRLTDLGLTDDADAGRSASSRPARKDRPAKADATRLDDQPGSDASFIMPIDDVFHIKGRGTVVTGRITQGRITAGDAVEISGDGHIRHAVVVMIEMFRKILDGAAAGDNVGLLLRGNDEQFRKGMVVVKR
jgi:hypothetical protein